MLYGGEDHRQLSTESGTTPQIHGMVEEFTVAVEGAEEGSHLLTKPLLGTVLIEEICHLIGGQFEGRPQNRLDLLPSIRISGQFSMRRRSQALAVFHSRLIVASERPMARAVWAWVKPPK